MPETYMFEIRFDKIDYLSKGEYESCTFNGCDFSGQDFSGFKFSDCTFKNCNLSLAKLNKSSLTEINFRDCKMLGLRFDTCDPFGLSFSFENCQLNHSSFFRTKIKKTVFRNSQLQETDFVEADLTAAVFDNCNFQQAIFDRTILEKSDFRNSYNFSIDPENNRIKKARFSISGVLGLLSKYELDVEP